jgi:hypothetical protein
LGAREGSIAEVELEFHTPEGDVVELGAEQNLFAT